MPKQGYGQKPYTQPPFGEDTNKIHREGATHEQDRPRTIFGLRRTTFAIVAILALLVIIGAAVGGGVGGSLASKNNKKKTNDNIKLTPTPTASPSTREAPSITTTSIVGPSATLLRDCDSSNNTVYATTFGSSTSLWRKMCSNAYTNANGFDSVVAQQFNTLNDCINLCATYNFANKTAIQSGNNRICNSVCWRNEIGGSNDAAPGMCFGFTIQNITSNGQTQFKINSPAETRCDSAALMNPDF